MVNLHAIQPTNHSFGPQIQCIFQRVVYTPHLVFVILVSAFRFLFAAVYYTPHNLSPSLCFNGRVHDLMRLSSIYLHSNNTFLYAQCTNDDYDFE